MAPPSPTSTICWLRASRSRRHQMAQHVPRRSASVCTRRLLKASLEGQKQLLLMNRQWRQSLQRHSRQWQSRPRQSRLRQSRQRRRLNSKPPPPSTSCSKGCASARRSWMPHYALSGCFEWASRMMSCAHPAIGSCSSAASLGASCARMQARRGPGRGWARTRAFRALGAPSRRCCRLSDVIASLSLHSCGRRLRGWRPLASRPRRASELRAPNASCLRFADGSQTRVEIARRSSITAALITTGERSTLPPCCVF